MKDSEAVEIEPDAWCAWCGDPLPEPEERYHHQKFCCIQCQWADSYDRLKRQPRKARIVPKACSHCGESFKPVVAYQTYCGSMCRSEAYNARRRVGKGPIPWRRCESCGTRFEANPVNKRCCSSRCTNAKNNAARRARLLAIDQG